MKRFFLMFGKLRWIFWSTMFFNNVQCLKKRLERTKLAVIMNFTYVIQFHHDYKITYWFTLKMLTCYFKNLKARERLVGIAYRSLCCFYSRFSRSHAHSTLVTFWGVSTLSRAPFGVGPVAQRWSTWWVNRAHWIVVEGEPRQEY